MKQQQDWEYSREILLPFSLQLDSGSTLLCHEILRCLPGRRLVCRATRGKETLLLKMFLGGEAWSAAEEDAVGVRALMAAGISTPAMLSEERVAAKGYPVLLFEFLDHARSFRESWEAVEQTEGETLLRGLLEMVAALHEAGLRQRDFHLRNFLVDQTNGLYAIDGGDYEVLPNAIDHRAAVRNLGILFGHLPRAVLQTSPQLLQAYAEKRGWPEDRHLLGKVISGANQFRLRRARTISRKAFRDCSEFTLRRSGRLHIYQRRDLGVAVLDDWIRRSKLELVSGDDRMLKDGNSQTVWLTLLGDRQVVVKRYNLKNWRHRLRRAFSRSRAARSWENAHSLRAYHIRTPRPLAMIEERSGPFRGRAWLITDWVDGVGANRYFQQLQDSPETRAKMAELARVVVSLGENELVHADMKATNFLLQGDNVYLIDLDSMHRPRLPEDREKGIRADRQRFLANWKTDWQQQGFRDLIKDFSQD